MTSVLSPSFCGAGGGHPQFCLRVSPRKDLQEEQVELARLLPPARPPAPPPSGSVIRLSEEPLSSVEVTCFEVKDTTVMISLSCGHHPAAAEQRTGARRVPSRRVPPGPATGSAPGPLAGSRRAFYKRSGTSLWQQDWACQH